MNSKIQPIGLICFMCIVALIPAVSCVHDTNNCPDCLRRFSKVVTVYTDKFTCIDRSWQNRKCYDLGLSLDTTTYHPNDTFPSSKPLNTPEKNQLVPIIPIDTENSFYRALSYLVTGTENNFVSLKEKVKEEILKLIKDDENTDRVYNNPLQNTQTTTVTLNEIYAATSLLDTSIYVYSSPVWAFYNKCEVTKQFKEDDCYIYLQMSPEGHYDIVTNVVDSD